MITIASPQYGPQFNRVHLMNELMIMITMINTIEHNDDDDDDDEWDDDESLMITTMNGMIMA